MRVMISTEDRNGKQYDASAEAKQSSFIIIGPGRASLQADLFPQRKEICKPQACKPAKLASLQCKVQDKPKVTLNSVVTHAFARPEGSLR